MGVPLFDMHCHLDWFGDAGHVARDAESLGLSIFANTVAPDAFARARDTFESHGNVIVGIGAHPWWIADRRIEDADIGRAARFAYDHAFVGEIGLDFSDAHTPNDSHGRQVAALERILLACDAGARSGMPKLVSLHAVRSAQVVLDLLEKTGCLDSCRCVFHWFSGTSDELHRAVGAGCLFSVNEMMLRTRRGREYARQLPPDRLLTETDLPPEEKGDCAATDIVTSLTNSLDALEALRGADMAATVAANAARLL